MKEHQESGLAALVGVVLLIIILIWIFNQHNDLKLEQLKERNERLTGGYPGAGAYPAYPGGASAYVY